MVWSPLRKRSGRMWYTFAFCNHAGVWKLGSYTVIWNDGNGSPSRGCASAVLVNVVVVIYVVVAVPTVRLVPVDLEFVVVDGRRGWHG